MQRSKFVLILFASLVLACVSNSPLFAQTSLTEMNAVNSIQSGMAAGDAGAAQQAGGGAGGGGAQDGAAAGGVSANEKQHAEAILKTGWWGPGGYFSITKIILFILVFWYWVFVSDWVNGDMERLKNPNRENTNLINVGISVGLGLVAFFIPIFWVAFPAFLLIVITPPLLYAKARNQTLQEHEKVLTRDHLVHLFARFVNMFGAKMSVKKQMAYEGGAPVELKPSGQNVDNKELQGRLIVARNHAGFNFLRDYLFDGLNRDAIAVLFDYQVQRTIVRHNIDGVWHDVADVPRVTDNRKDKEAAGKSRLELALESAKMLVGGNPDERAKKQTGTFVTALRKKTLFDTVFTAQGVPTGERVLFEFNRQKASLKSLDELGMSASMQTELVNHLNAKQGFFVFAAPVAGGLRTTITISLRASDRFTRDVACVEDKRKPYENVENTMMTFYDSFAGETPMTVLPDVFFKEPNALILHDMVNVETLTRCCEEVENERLIITSNRARDSVEAVYRLLAMKVAPPLFVSKLTGVLAVRLIRKLCPDCKEEYTPSPQLLQQIRVPASAVKGPFCRQRVPLPEHEERKRGPCQTCNDIGYKGRTALFELITFNEDIRAALLGKPDPAAVRKAIEASKQPGFLQAGLNAVMQGTTSVEELMRVMKTQ
ncbi:MAG: ATPase, T2SS/T4P/T4SS family [Thermoguttaceae bacterium]